MNTSYISEEYFVEGMENLHTSYTTYRSAKRALNRLLIKYPNNILQITKHTKIIINELLDIKMNRGVN